MSKIRKRYNKIPEPETDRQGDSTSKRKQNAGETSKDPEASTTDTKGDASQTLPKSSRVGKAEQDTFGVTVTKGKASARARDSASMLGSTFSGYGDDDAGWQGRGSGESGRALLGTFEDENVTVAGPEYRPSTESERAAELAKTGSGGQQGSSK